ncbi:(2Fe-2S)-binding protein [Streptomyces qinzhouensis]|uniref:Ferric iron reductase n=1 Tax=Streptomyces qinzhouensis TaxID=2599401 RepID=A0A5B8INI8_9ACTN|nr:(2Fe-2S)-binding protein [Streptomyces qinzhouensis]QDY80238.1 ferric iron reductase [Streptomyces qinzhouensis]
MAEVGAIGGFFALRTGAPHGTADGSVSTLAAVYAGDGGPLNRRIDRVAARLGIEERRVAASIAHLGLAARLWSIAIGHAVLHGALPALHPADLRWSPDHSSPDDLLLTDPHTLPASVDTILRTVQEGHLVPLAAALRRTTRISQGLLRGNAGSALAGAVREIDAWAARTGRPEAATGARTLAEGLFAHPGLAGTVHGSRMRRRSCCLYYRAGGGLCGDCVFDTPPRPAGPGQPVRS